MLLWYTKENPQGVYVQRLTPSKYKIELLTIINDNPIYVKAVNPFFANGYIEAEFRCSKASCEMLENHNYRLSFNLVQKKKVSGQ